MTDDNSLIRIMNNQALNSTLNDAQLLELQQKIFSLLSRRAKLYSSGDTSLSLDDAQGIMQSVCFTLDEYLRFNNIPVAALLGSDEEDIFDLAVLTLKSELASVKRLFSAVSLTAPAYMSISYSDTLKGIGKYLNSYDVYYMSHLVPPDIDYQLCIPADESHKGIRYVNDYLSNLYVENRFLKRFKPENIISVLRTGYVDFKSVPLNMFEPVAVNAIALSLSGDDVFSLNVKNDTAEKITALVQNESDDFKKLFISAAERLCSLLNFNGVHEKEYVLQTALNQLPRISCGNVKSIFTSFRAER